MKRKLTNSKIPKIIISESVFDFKYRSIFEKIENLEVIECTFFHSLLILIKNPKRTIYHIRYIKYENFFQSSLRLILLKLIVFFTNNKIMWSCHNFYEHNITNQIANDILRNTLLRISNYVFVFHRDIKAEMPVKHHSKIFEANFGSFIQMFEGKTAPNNDFRKKYFKWLNNRSIDYPDIVYISSAKRTDISALLNLSEQKLNVLIIAPGCNFKSNKDNIFIYTEGPVFAEVHDLLQCGKKLIGFVGHNNFSVPTSLYMFASYSVPIISVDCKPASSIVALNRLGLVLDANSELFKCIEEIQLNYKKYSHNCKTFIQDNSWKKSSNIHEEVIFEKF